MRIVLDTNCLLVIVPTVSPYHKILKSIRTGAVKLVLTTEIIHEYEEVLSRFYSTKLAKDLINQLLLISGTELITVFYKWNLITKDPDDNKFIDCAIAAEANYPVSNDKHFNVLKKTKFPKVNLLSLDSFMKQL